MKQYDEEDDVQFLKKQIELLDGENHRLRRDNEMLMKSLEAKEKLLKNKNVPAGELDRLNQIILFRDAQIQNLEEKVKSQQNTIKSLQENMIESQVHKIPQYQKTIVFLNESIMKLQEENEQLKKKVCED